MMKDIKLTKNFNLSELVKSSTADRLAIDNWPTDFITIQNLYNVAVNILQPVREHYGIPFSPNSGYRSPALNRAVGGSTNSQHMKGEAVDFELPGIANYDLAVWVRDNLDFDQLILEMYNPNEGPNSGWVHCSYKSKAENRKEVLTIFPSSYGGGTVRGLHKAK